MNSSFSVGDIVKLPTGNVEILGFESNCGKKYILYKCLSCGQKNKKLAYPSHFKKGGCPICYREKKSKIHIGDIVSIPTGNVKVLDICYPNGKRHIKYQCLECGQINERISGNFEKFGCPVCSNRIVVKGINDITTTAKWMIPYFQGGEYEASLYTKSSRNKINPICPFCNTVLNKKMSIDQIYRQKSIGCICGDKNSYPNKFMYRLLQIKNINFMREWSPKWISPKRYDFYIPSMKLIIEMDGGIGHGNPIKSFGITTEESLENDKFKDSMAAKHSLNVLRVDSRKSSKEYIGTQCKNILSKYINITDDDLIECDKFATNNIAKKVCEYYMANKQSSIRDIVRKFGFSNVTIQKWLKNGVGLGWCDYTIEQSKQRGLVRKNKTLRKNSKPIYIYSMDGTLLKEYSCVNDCIEHSLSDFGMLFYKPSVYRVLEGRGKSYHSLILSYEKMK